MNLVKNMLLRVNQHVKIQTIPIYLLFLAFFSFHYILSLVGNVAFLFYLISSVRRRRTVKNFHITIMSISLCNLITFHIMPADYAELLPWEVGLHIFFYLAAFYYYYCYHQMRDINSKNDKKVFDFKQRENYFIT